MLLGAYLSEHYNHHYYAKAPEPRPPAEAPTTPRRSSASTCCVLPTTAMKARPHPGADARDPRGRSPPRSATCTTPWPFDVTGNPALSVPCGMSDGLPIGMMLVGRHFDDATVLRAGHAFQAS